MAAVVPVALLWQGKAGALRARAGSGRDLWGEDSRKAIENFRDERQT